MRWLLLKDLRILRRSPLLVGLLVAYPILVSLLIGFALSRGPDEPRVAIVNQVPETAGTLSIGGEQVEIADYAGRLYEAIEPVEVETREEAVELVRSGEVLGALIIPEDVTRKLQSAVSLGASAEKPTVEVIVNTDGPLAGEYVDALIDTRLADANLALSERVTEVAAGYLNILLRGGDFSVLGQEFQVLGLRASAQILQDVARTLPEGSPRRDAVERVRDFAQLAIDNLDLSDEVLASISAPIQVDTTQLAAGSRSLDAFAVAVAVAVSLMFVCLLLAAGMLALEREEHAFTRLVRGLVSRLGLVVEKVVLAALCSFAVGVLMVLALGAFVDVDLGRAPQWVPALALGAAAFGALGVAIGALARDVRAASLLAFLLSLPLAFLALVPSGAVGAGLYDVIQIVSAAFPFKPTLEALDAALNDTGATLLGPLAHLAGLTAAFVVVARVALRRFG